MGLKSLFKTLDLPMVVYIATTKINISDSSMKIILSAYDTVNFNKIPCALVT